MGGVSLSSKDSARGTQHESIRVLGDHCILEAVVDVAVKER